MTGAGSRAMEDVPHQPYRKRLVPGMTRVIGDALRAGPSIPAPKGSQSSRVGRSMQRAFLRFKTESRYCVLDIDPLGAVVETIP